MTHETEMRRRLLRRAELAFPGRRAAVVTESDLPPDLEGCDVIGAVRRADERPFAGFTLASTRRHRHAVPLHAVLAQVRPWLGRPFAPTGVFHHVGERLCLRPAADLREEIWVRDGIDVSAARQSGASPWVLGWITAAGLGFLPVVGATAASVATAALAFALGMLGDWEGVRLFLVALAGVTTVVSVWVERAAARHFLTDDPREFVLDEVAGMAVTLCFVPALHWPWGVAVALIAFRFFDVLKPGIVWVERLGWRGTIVWDDLLAGLYAGLVTWVVMSAGAMIF